MTRPAMTVSVTVGRSFGLHHRRRGRRLIHDLISWPRVHLQQDNFSGWHRAGEPQARRRPPVVMVSAGRLQCQAQMSSSGHPSMGRGTFSQHQRRRGWRWQIESRRSDATGNDAFGRLWASQAAPLWSAHPATPRKPAEFMTSEDDLPAGRGRVEGPDTVPDDAFIGMVSTQSCCGCTSCLKGRPCLCFLHWREVRSSG